jgi:hypothetical protein
MAERIRNLLFRKYGVSIVGQVKGELGKLMVIPGHVFTGAFPRGTSPLVLLERGDGGG